MGECFWIGLEQRPGDGEAGHDDGDHRHELDEDVERGAGGVFEGVAYGVANYGGLVHVGAFAAEVAFLDIFLGVVPRAAGVGHEDGKNEACGEAAGEQAYHAGHAEDDAHKDRHGYGEKRREHHLALRALGGNLHATCIVRLGLAGEDAFDFAELAAHFLHHMSGGAAHGVHR